MTSRNFEKLLLVGDSMIEFFDWQERFPDHQVHNLGRSGESVEELRARAPQIVERFTAPDLVLVMIGTNNVAMGNFTFLSAYEDILETFQEAYPDAVIVVNSLLPMELGYLALETVPRVNSSLKSMAVGCGAIYLDSWTAMVDKTGRVREDILEDEVHLTNQGYQVWAAELEKLLAGLVPCNT
ncbi:MAG: GDSL-type esterase/lipase family protein [Thermodesulfobacteriota bacterium]